MTLQAAPEPATTASADKPKQAASATPSCTFNTHCGALSQDGYRVGIYATLVLATVGGGFLAISLFGRQGPISFDGNAGGFGGRAWGWQVSRALVMMLVSAAFMLSASVLVMMLVQRAPSGDLWSASAPAVEKKG